MWTQDGYLRCDLCFIYFEMFQYPDHRRACGRREPKVDDNLKNVVESQIEGGVAQKELKMKQAQRAATRSGYDTRRRLESEADAILAQRAKEKEDSKIANNKSQTTQGTSMEPDKKAESQSKPKPKDDDYDPLLAMLDPERFGKKK